MNGCNGTVTVVTAQSTSLTSTGDSTTASKTSIGDANIDVTESTPFEISTSNRSYSEQEEFSTGKLSKFLLY